MTLDELTHLAHDLEHDMRTCGFNTYGVKRNTYYNWCRRIEQLANGLREASEAPAPPPPPTRKASYDGTD